MIIDADTHVTPNGEGILYDDLIQMLDKAGIDKAITWLQPPYMREIRSLNEYVYKATMAHPKRLLGFGWVDPHLGFENAITEIDWCIEKYGFYGIKLNGAQNSFYIDDPEKSYPIIELIAKTGKILALHVGADAYEFTHPYRVGKIAKKFPEIPILMVHMGGAGLPSLSNAAIEIAKENSNITLIGSAISPKDILKAIKGLGSKRVCFGSDAPFELPHVEHAKYDALLDGMVDKNEKNDIMGGNIERLLNIT